MISIPLAYWAIIAAVAVVVVAATVLLLGRRRHIEIEAPTLDDRIVGSTLARSRAQPPTSEPQSPPAEIATFAAPAAASDDLSRMKGVGPRLVARLNELGILRYDQIAGWADADIAAIDAGLGTFAGRIVRDRWVEQARYLATDDIAGFEAQFGKIDGGQRVPDAIP